MRVRTKVLITAAAAVPLVLVGAGTAYATHYQDRALPGSTLGGVSVAGLTRGEVAATVQQRAADLTVTLDTGTTTRTAHLADLGYTVDVEPTVDAVFAANGSWSSYATSLLSGRDVDAVLRTDPGATRDVLADLVATAGKAGSDARVRLAPDKKSFVVLPAVTGKSVMSASFHDVVAAAGRDLASATATLEYVDAEPAVTTAQAQKVADRANALVARTVKVLDGDDAHAASRRTKASWISVTGADGALADPTVNAAKVKAWVQEVADDVEVTATSGLRNVDASGKVKQVVQPARDGAVMTNAADLAKAATAALSAGKAYKGSFEHRTIPATWTERRIAAGAERLVYPATDGEKWVDVDLKAHTMTAYVGAKAVHGPIKMVNGSDKKPTIVGTFRVYLKREVQTMRGSNADGTRYETPDVPYISYFHNGFALHGAPWRSSFGYAGERGSHGCINLPVPSAKWVYDFASVGTPVVTHF
jgi:lipoprotein-anchoring transpeptidase ErfK/SrfK